MSTRSRNELSIPEDFDKETSRADQSDDWRKKENQKSKNLKNTKAQKQSGLSSD